MTPLQDYLDTARVIAPSLVTAAALAISAGMLGVFVLLRRQALLALAMPQVVAVGTAVALRMGWPALPPALGAVVVAMLLLIWSKRSGADNWLIGSLYIGGLAISFLIIAHGAQHVAELQARFTGIDVAVSIEQAQFSAPLLLLAGAVVAAAWRRWLLLAQAPDAAAAAGVRTERWDIGFLCLLAIVLLVGTSDLGAVMVLAMLFLPAAAVLPWTRTVPAALITSALLAIILLLAGFVCSMEWDLPLSQSVGAAGFAALIILHGLARLPRR